MSAGAGDESCITHSRDRRGRTFRRHEEVVRASYELISEVGLDRLTYDTLARRAKVGKATLYRYWRTRDDLAEDVMRFASKTEPMVTETDSGDTRADMIAWWTAITTPTMVKHHRVVWQAASSCRGERAADVETNWRPFPGSSSLLSVLERSADRGEISQSTISAMCMLLGFTATCVIAGHHLLPETPLRSADDVVDRVLLPILQGAGPGHVQPDHNGAVTPSLKVERE